MNPGELLVEDLAELRRTAKGSTAYQMLKAAAVMRRLLLDGDRFVDVVNRDHRIKIHFEISSLPTLPDCLPRGEHLLEFMPDGFEPGSGGWGSETMRLRRDNFLKHHVIRVNGAGISVRQVIRFCANVAGGVHLRDPKDGEEQLLAKLNAEFHITDLPLVIRHLRGIARVVLRALTPLAAQAAQRRLLVRDNATLRDSELPFVAEMFGALLEDDRFDDAARIVAATMRLAVRNQHTSGLPGLGDVLVLACRLGNALNDDNRVGELERLVESLYELHKTLTAPAEEWARTLGLFATTMAVVWSDLNDVETTRSWLARAREHLADDPEQTLRLRYAFALAQFRKLVPHAHERAELDAELDQLRQRWPLDQELKDMLDAENRTSPTDNE